MGDFVVPIGRFRRARTQPLFAKGGNTPSATFTGSIRNVDPFGGSIAWVNLNFRLVCASTDD